MTLTWECFTCHRTITEPEWPHTDTDTGEDVCEGCCTYCSSGQRDADQDQYIKEHKTLLNVGYPEEGHGLPTHEQAATIEMARRLGGTIGGHVRGTSWSCTDCSDRGTEPTEQDAALALYFHRRSHQPAAKS